MKALENIKMAKRIRLEIPKTQDSYGSQVDKYSKELDAGVKFNWYYGNYGNSSTYDILASSFNKDLVNRVASRFLTQNINTILELIAKEYEKEALKEKDELLKLKSNIEAFLLEVE